jgi:predicted MFS family arabinose efflux permease
MVLGVLGLLGLWLVHRILPPGDRTTPTANARWSAAALFASGRAVWRRPGVRGLLGISFLLSLAIEIPFIVYGAWLEDSFHLSLSRLGLASMVVGLAEGAAEAGSSQLTDRWGKRRSVLAGLLGLAAGLVALPWLARLGLVGALLGIAAVVLAFEFAIVSVLPLATELVPDARASLLSFNVMSNTTGRMLGSLAGGRLWEWQTTGIALNAFAGAGCALVAAVLLIRGLHDIDDS